MNDTLMSGVELEQTAEVNLAYKAKFNRALEPFKVMLAARRKELSPDDWLSLVERTKESIPKNPDQYLGKELPKPDVLKTIIDNLFEKFIQNELSL